MMIISCDNRRHRRFQALVKMLGTVRQEDGLYLPRSARAKQPCELMIEKFLLDFENYALLPIYAMRMLFSWVHCFLMRCTYH